LPYKAAQVSITSAIDSRSTGSGHARAGSARRHQQLPGA